MPSPKFLSFFLSFFTYLPTYLPIAYRRPFRHVPRYSTIGAGGGRRGLSGFVDAGPDI